MSRTDDEYLSDLYININSTQYDIISTIAEDLHWQAIDDPDDGDCDVIWQDGALSHDTLSSLKGFQRVNHFPGIYSIARKDHLAKNLKVMQKLFPEHYDFFPSTWVLPREAVDFRKQFSAKRTKRARTFIVKPEASSQGRGIFLTRRLDEIPEKCVVQRYLHKAYLLDGLKFDIRLYVLISACDPLRLFIHREGLLRLATEKYCAPVPSNLDNLCMHLTNYAINKENPNFEFNVSSEQNFVGHKRSFKAFLEYLKEQDEDVDRLWEEICDIAVKVVCVVQPLLSHLYRSSQASELSNVVCFQVLGLDIFLDHTLRPYLLEVNHTPSFTTDTPLDYEVKYSVLSDTLKLLGLKSGNRKRYNAKYQQNLVERTSKGVKDFRTLREKIKEQALKRRQRIEMKFQGGFELIFSKKNAQMYEEFMHSAKDIWLSNLTVKKPLKPPEDQKKNEKRKKEIKLTDKSAPIPPPINGIKTTLTTKPKRPKQTPYQITSISPDDPQSKGSLTSSLKRVSSKFPPINPMFGTFLVPTNFDFSSRQVFPKMF